MTNKEKNFVSAVVYLRNDEKKAVSFFETLYKELEEHFEKFELVAVNNACSDQTVAKLREWANAITHPLTFVNMSIQQGKEICMNAGLDMAIGDYVYEFDSVNMSYPSEMIFEAYSKATEGNDIVSVCPSAMKPSSRLFYHIFNKSSNSAYQLRSAAFRLVTRRAINRVRATSDYMPYRKAAYAASGLKMANLEFKGEIVKPEEKFGLAIDSLLLYSEAGTRVGLGISSIMFLITIAVLIYAIIIYCTGQPIEGWTTTMFIISLGFSGVFSLMTVLIKYLSLLVDLVFKKQKYFIESIEKVQK